MDPTKVVEQANKLFEQLAKLHKEFFDLWAKNVFLSWRWFIGIGLIFIPWIVWLIIRKKQSTDRLLHAGFSVMLMGSFLDVIGIATGLWSYPYNVFPLMPEFIPFDISALPVTTMVFIQFFPKMKAIYKAIVYAGVGSFVFQPLMKWINLYDNLHWQHYYSFPILIGIYMVANYVANKNKYDKLY